MSGPAGDIRGQFLMSSHRGLVAWPYRLCPQPDAAGRAADTPRAIGNGIACRALADLAIAVSSDPGLLGALQAASGHRRRRRHGDVDGRPRPRAQRGAAAPVSSEVDPRWPMRQWLRLPRRVARCTPQPAAAAIAASTALRIVS